METLASELEELLAAPKAELHVHQMGAVPPATLLELGRRHRVEMPADTVEGLREAFRFRDFAHFQECFVRYLAPCLPDAESLELATWAFFEELAAQGVQYAEVMFAARRYALVMPSEAFLAALDRARRRARTELGLEVWWIFEIGRDLPDPRQRRYWADYTLEVAIGSQDQGVIALGLSGSEDGHPPEEFAPWFERARAAGLHSVPHAGEHAGPDSVRGAVEALHAERIAHGVRAVEDPALVALLAERGVVLDTCPTSNVCLGVCPSIDAHPLRRLHEAGVSVTVNTDDPTLFGNTLSDEVGLLLGPLGLDVEAAREIIANGFRHGFMSS